MKVRSHVGCIAAAVAAVLYGGTVQARDLIWDANADADPRGAAGGGYWDTTTANWIDGDLVTGTNVLWSNSPADSAYFGDATTAFDVNVQPHLIAYVGAMTVQDIFLGTASDGGTFNFADDAGSLTLAGNVTKLNAAGLPQFQLMNGPITLTAGDHVFALNDSPDNVAELSINGVSNGLAGSGNLIVDNGTFQTWGTLALNSANSYTGTTQVNNGRLVISASNALGATSAGTTIGSIGTLSIGGAGSVLLGGLNIAEPITIKRDTYTGGTASDPQAYERYRSAISFTSSGAAGPLTHTLSGPLVVDSTDARIAAYTSTVDITSNITEGSTVSPGTGVLTLDGDFAGFVNLRGNNTGIGAGGIRIMGGVQVSALNHNNLGGASAPIQFAGGTFHPVDSFMTNFGSHPINQETFSGGLFVDAGKQFTIDIPLGRALDSDADRVGSIGKRGPGTLNLAAPINLRGGQTFWDSGTVNVNSVVQLHSLHLRSPVVNIGTGGVVSTHVGYSAIGQDTNGTNGGPDIAVINITGNGQLIQLNADDFNISDNPNTEGTINIHDQGVLTTTGITFLGKRSGTTGTINQYGGTVNINRGGDFALVMGDGRNGNLATGHYNMSGGTLNVNGETYVGEGAVGTGTFTMTGGTVNQKNWFVIGREGGAGTASISNGAIFTKTAGGNVEIDAGSSNGQATPSVLTVDNATFDLVTGELRVGTGGGADGTLNINNGATVNVNSWIGLGRDNGKGVINLASGSLNKAGGNNVSVGWQPNSNGLLNQTGGAFNVSTGEVWLSEGGIAKYDISGGTGNTGRLDVGRAGGKSGELVVRGTGALTSTEIVVGNGDSVSGTINLDGGSLTTGSIRGGGSSGTKTLNLNGGTLRAGGDSAAFIQSLTAVNIQNGGAVIDSNGFNVTIAQPLAAPGAGGLTKSGAGTLALTGANVYSGATAVNAGTLQLVPGSASLIKSGAVTVASDSKIDLTDNKLITSSPVGTFVGGAYTGVSGLVDTARGNGGTPLWDGTSGITTSHVDAQGSNLVSIGVAKVGDFKGIADGATTTFAGQTVLGSDTVAMVTWGGDATLDGKINIDDYGRIDANVSQSGSVFGWYNGDFNYDGAINIDDYGIIDGNISKQGEAFPTAGAALAGAALATADGVSAVPEPASLSLVALGAMGMMRRRRRVVN